LTADKLLAGHKPVPIGPGHVTNGLKYGIIPHNAIARRRRVRVLHETKESA
jgi:hypothetical protein